MSKQTYLVIGTCLYEDSGKTRISGTIAIAVSAVDKADAEDEAANVIPRLVPSEVHEIADVQILVNEPSEYQRDKERANQ